jgi:TolA-binding protein
LGFNILWGKQKELEERIERQEKLLAEHESEIRGLKDRISKLENSAVDFARNLLESAKKDPDPQSALTKVRIAMVFDTSQTAKRMEDSLTNLISQADKESYIRRINVFLRNKLYSDALAEALVFLENYPKDRDALRAYNQVKGEVEKQKEANKIKEETNRKFESSKIQRIENLISKGDYVSASKLVSTLPEGPDKIRFSNTLRRTAEEYLRKAKELIANKDWVQAKYYIEKSMKIYPLPESPGLLSYVESNIKASSETLYLKSLELYQKGDIQGAYAYIKEAIRLDPNNEKYRNVYYRLGNVLKED